MQKLRGRKRAHYSSHRVPTPTPPRKKEKKEKKKSTVGPGQRVGHGKMGGELERLHREKKYLSQKKEKPSGAYAAIEPSDAAKYERANKERMDASRERYRDMQSPEPTTVSVQPAEREHFFSTDDPVPTAPVRASLLEAEPEYVVPPPQRPTHRGESLQPGGERQQIHPRRGMSGLGAPQPQAPVESPEEAGDIWEDHQRELTRTPEPYAPTKRDAWKGLKREVWEVVPNIDRTETAKRTKKEGFGAEEEEAFLASGAPRIKRAPTPDLPEAKRVRFKPPQVQPPVGRERKPIADYAPITPAESERFRTGNQARLDEARKRNLSPVAPFSERPQAAARLREADVLAKKLLRDRQRADDARKLAAKAHQEDEAKRTILLKTQRAEDAQRAEILKRSAQRERMRKEDEERRVIKQREREAAEKRTLETQRTRKEEARRMGDAKKGRGRA